MKLKPGQPSMVRDLIVSILGERGALTSGELAEAIREETGFKKLTDPEWTGGGIWRGSWQVYGDCVALEKKGRIRRIQAKPRATILWAPK